jgi:hypothetical protein
MAFRRLSLILLILLFFGLMHRGTTQSSGTRGFLLAKDTIISTNTTEGYFLRMEMGDYYHAIFRRKDGREISFFADPKFETILTNLRGKLLKISYTVKKTPIPEAGGIMKIEVLNHVEYGGKLFKT